jgi:hypothetical protein
MKNKKTSKEDKQDGKSFWTTLPGILTGIAATITAIGTLVAALSSTGLFSPKATPLPATSTPVISTATELPTPTMPPTITPAPPPSFVTDFVYNLNGSEFVADEFKFEPGMLPAETMTDFIQLSRVAFGKLETSDFALNARLAINNTGAQPLILELNQRFFTLEDDQGRTAELVYFCCATKGDVLAPGQKREVQLFFRMAPEWYGKGTSAYAIFLRVRGLLPVLRASWRFPTLATAE